MAGFLLRSSLRVTLDGESVCVAAIVDSRVAGSVGAVVQVALGGVVSVASPARSAGATVVVRVAVSVAVRVVKAAVDVGEAVGDEVMPSAGVAGGNVAAGVGLTDVGIGDTVGVGGSVAVGLAADTTNRISRSDVA